MSRDAFCKEWLPNYRLLSPNDINELIAETTSDGKLIIKNICESDQPCNWETTIVPISQISEKIHRIWGAANHLSSVSDSPAIRDVINKNLEQVTSFWTDFSQNRDCIRFLTTSRGISKTSHPQQHKVLCDYIRDFELAGANLEEDAKLNLKNSIELNKLAQRFSENLLDSTKATAIKVGLIKKENQSNHWKVFQRMFLNYRRKRRKKEC